jgi:hypothetical protein
VIPHIRFKLHIPVLMPENSWQKVRGDCVLKVENSEPKLPLSTEDTPGVTMNHVDGIHREIRDRILDDVSNIKWNFGDIQRSELITDINDQILAEIDGSCEPLRNLAEFLILLR